MACSFHCSFNTYFFTDDQCKQCNASCALGTQFQGCNPDGTPICTTCTQSLPVHSEWEKNLCVHKCDPGYYAFNSSLCLPCDTSPCPVGEYRDTCQAVVGAVCQQCTTKRSTMGAYQSYEAFITPGVPFDVDNCKTECVAGAFRHGPNCFPCRQAPFASWELLDPVPHWTLACTRVQDAKAMPCTSLKNGRYTGYATALDRDCPAVCNPGYYLERVPTGFQVPYWELGTQPGNQTSMTVYVNISRCIPCMSSPLTNGAYTDACNYVCDKDYVKDPNASMPYRCLYCPGQACSSGEYQSGCGASAACKACDPLSDPHRTYTGQGYYMDPASCPEQCASGYWAASTAVNCTACTAEASLNCSLATHFVRRCAPTSDAKCLPCTASCDRKSAVCPLPQPIAYQRAYNSTYCGYCNPNRVCGVGTYMDACQSSNGFTGCSPCRNGLAQNSTVIYMTAGDPYSPYSCSWKCATGYTLGRNSSGGLACLPPVNYIMPTPAPLQTPSSYCPPGQFLTNQLTCQACSDVLPSKYATWTTGCSWICTGGRIAVQHPIQKWYTCMLYSDYQAIALNPRRVMVQSPFNDTYRPHVVGYSQQASGIAAAGFACIVGFIGMGLLCCRYK
ncbi:hypothetical protein GUITHDRAFT_117713 [Guillardia theta CCMP2712]|uniref:TNFR-Cys domain-containing protein n=1 Tax=Guillardia theta (strain CCMP2712) TaxID=905079 RepID=L1IIX5_GUITC|nr:hypothetical protein GUITHDRAFT_117713 [Guillardia theta CCMP2712]EKX36191.1 hypothetical protein GUITHDRAFT_117713 [Guillardia theta CCMP2712]|eukprot:XP_005823171.1 hypothetical protein GUITHDRAFT_117713 [Guillardia theta CCMP2712]